MTVDELIAELKRLPPHMSVVVWDAEEDDEVPVTGAVYEDGSSDVLILTSEGGSSNYVLMCFKCEAVIEEKDHNKVARSDDGDPVCDSCASKEPKP